MEKFDPRAFADSEIERLTLRLSHTSKEELAKIAQNENVSLNTLIIRCIDYALKNINSMDLNNDDKKEKNK